MGIGKELKRLRDDVPMSVDKIAKRIGVNPDRWRKWEELDQKPRSEDTAIIESFFNMSLKELVKKESIKEFLIVPHGTIENSNEVENQKNSDNRFNVIISYLKDLQRGQVEIINQGLITRREVSGVADYLMLKDAEWDPGKLKALKETYYSIVRGEVPAGQPGNKLKGDGKLGKAN